MKLIYFHQHFSTPKGSVGQRSYEMARRLIQRGHQVTMICGSYQGGVTGLNQPFSKGVRKGVVDQINVIEFDLAYSNSDNFIKRSFTFFKFVIRSSKLIFTLNYDLVFATTTPLTAGIPGILARWFKHKPFVFEVRDLWPELPKAMGVITNPLIIGCLSILEKMSYHSATQLIALSPGMVEGIIRCGISRDKVHLVSNGCDIELFGNPSIGERPLGILPSDLLAVYSGTHGMANGLDAVIDAAVILKQRNQTQIKLLLIGQGKCKSLLQARVRQEGLEKIVYFLDPIPKPKLAGLLACSDLGMQILANVPAFYDGTSPNKFFDYIAVGLPVLINYPGWLGKKVQDKQCGFVVSPNDPQSFANTLETALNQKQILKDMGRSAKQLAEQEFDRLMLSNLWVNVIEKAANIEVAPVASF